MAVHKRISIRLLMAVIFYLAADFAIIRAALDSSGPHFGVAIVVLPFMNLLLLNAPRLRVGGKTRLFWIGFETVGWALLFLVGCFAWNSPDSFFRPIDWIDKHLPAVGEVENFALQIVFALIFYTAPQLLAALLAGRLTANYRVKIERR